MDCARQVKRSAFLGVIMAVALLGAGICAVSVQALGKTQDGCARLTEKLDLMPFINRKAHEQRGVLEAGDGVTLTLAPVKNSKNETQLTVRHRAKVAATLKTTYYFSACFCLEARQARYWVVEAYTGGAHCCFTHYYFCRPEAGKPVRALGQIDLGHAQEDDDWGNLSPGNIFCLQGQPYIRYFDTRFAAFGTCYARSHVMFFPVFYRLSPDGMPLSSRSFKEVYQREIQGLDQAITAAAGKLTSKPEKIGEIKTGDGDAVWDSRLSGDLAILLTARTIHYLAAREESRAWQTLKRDVGKYYRTDQGLEALKQNLLKIMAESPY